MVKIILLIVLAFSFWKPLAGSIVFVAISSLFLLWIYIAQYSGEFSINNVIFSPKEREIIKKYHVYFRWPFISKINSSAASGIYIFGAILLVWVLWNHFWIIAGILLICIIAAGKISTKLNPVYFLHDAVERRNKYEYEEEMNIVDSICEKIATKTDTEND